MFSDISTKMTRLYGRARKGQKCLSCAPFGHWKATTFVAGLRVSGISGPLVLDGPMDGKAFLAYVRQILDPSLRKGDIVVMDNLPAHKMQNVQAPIKATGA